MKFRLIQNELFPYPLKNLQHYSELPRLAQMPGFRVITNCFISMAEMEKFIRQGKVFLMETQGGVVYFIDHRDFFSLYFHAYFPLQNFKPCTLPDLEKPIILDLLYRPGREDDITAEISNCWIGSGFELYKRYIRFVLKLTPGERWERFTPRYDQQKYELGYAELEDIPAIRRLWDFALDPYSVPLPEEDDLRDMITARQIISVHTREGQLAAVSCPEVRGTIAYNWHTVVDEPHRGQGLVNAMKSLLYLDNPQVTRFYAWMEANNHRMIEIDKRTGYAPDGLEDRQLIKHPAAPSV